MLANLRSMTRLSGLARCMSSAKPSTFYFKDLQITKTKTPHELPKGELGFGQYISDHLFEVQWNEKEGWGKPKIVPTHNFSLHPFNTTLHYAFEGFEGMKAYRDPKNRIRSFRPEANAKRLCNTSQELCFPTFEPQEFVKCLDALLKVDEKWIPPAPSTLYMRPTIISMTNKLGVHPPGETMLYVCAAPSGSYFKGGVKPVKLKIEEVGVRAWPGGTGHVKAGANYTMGIKYVREAFAAGYAQVIWLNGKNITEAGACNIFFYWINKKGEKELITPKLDGTILPGITRDSVLQLAKEEKGFKTVEKEIPLEDLLLADKEKRIIEAFMVGTAVCVGPIGSIVYKKQEIIPKIPGGELSTKLRKRLEDIQFGRVEHKFSHLVI